MLAMLVTIVHTWFLLLLLLLSVNYNLNYNRVLHFSKATTFKSCLKVMRGFLSEPQLLNQTFKIMTFKWRQRKLNQRATIVKSAAVQSWISGFKLAGQVPLLYCIVYIFNFMSFAKCPRSKNCQFFFILFHLYHDQDLLLTIITIDSRKIQTFIYSWVFVMEFSPQQISGLFDLLPWTWARCPGWWGHLVVLREVIRECSCSLLSDKITHQLHVSLVFMQHLNYRCDPYKLFPEQIR